MKKNYVGIVGTIISGPSCNGWFGKLCGSDTVIKQIGDKGDVEVYINSPGGSVFAAFEIVTAFNTAIKAGRSVDVYVSPLAASAASYISTAIKGATVYMTENAKLMFHAPWTGLYGSKKELQDAAELLGKLEDDIKAAVQARSGSVDETWFETGRMKFLSTKEAVEMKLADRVGDPSAELVSFVSGQGMEESEEAGAWAKARLEGQNKQAGIDYELFAANVEFQGYLKHLCDEHYGEQTHIRDVTADTFKVVRDGGETALLKYKPDSLTIVAIDWGALASNKEDDMKNKKDVVDVTADLVVEPEVAPVAKESKVAPKATEPEKEPVADKEPATEPVEQPAVENVAEPKTDVEGLTPDMIAFAKENYDLARAEYIVRIKASSANAFTDKELEEFPIKMLEKLATLSGTPAGETKTVVDNSIVPSPKGQGTGGSLPPPEL